MDAKILSFLLQKLEANQSVKDRLLSLTESGEEINEVSQSADSLFQQILIELESVPHPISKSVKVRIYMAACMDIIHSGHFNCMRQARSLGDELVVGVIADSEIARCKGPPVMSEQERAVMAEACKWVDNVVVGVEYYVTPEILHRVGCDYVVHGDDIAIRKDTGTDAYADVRAAGMLKIVKRTEGISTTEMVGKMLLMTQTETAAESPSVTVSDMVKQSPTDRKFLATTRRITQFASNNPPKSTDRIVYVDGSFDLFHMGHVETIKRAKELGDYLIVGIHDDKTVNQHKGKNYPIMNLHERTLNVLALKYVDDVIMGAPWSVSEDMIKTLNISVVVQGSNHKDATDVEKGEDPYAVAKDKGVYVEVKSASEMNAEDIVQRIVANRLAYISRNTRMVANEASYYQTKTYVPEL